MEVKIVNKGKDSLVEIWKKMKSTKKIPMLIVLGIFLLCVIFGVVSWQKKRAEEKVIRENVALLEEMESAATDETEQQLQALRDQEAAEKAAALEAQNQDAEGHLVARDLVSLRQSFQGTMILGDSITEGLVSYQFLDTSVVVYARGKGVAKNDELIQTALDNKPGKVFMAFGMNDLGYYNGDADHFTEEYKNDIETLKNGIPGVEIYVNSILPTAESAAAKSPYFAEYPKFNEALEALCQEEGVTFIDNGFLLEEHPDYHEADGLHVSKDYYPLWMTNMAIKAGI